MTILLVRHARAGRRDRWKGDDRLRPLSKEGRAQAEALPALLRPLSKDRPVRLISSPWVRCLQTLEPLSGVLDVPIEPEDALGEAMGAKAVEALGGWLGPGTTVLCTHGDVVEALLAQIEKSGVRLRPKKVPPKGSVWCFTGTGHIDAARYLPPPA
ncbi:MAG TPA: phosphoglycerate mutase family protein [Acidimicrobiales bacterium]|nr:phosphoglycerate mutase family protein [Acidimicrobiales bacterium]